MLISRDVVLQRLGLDESNVDKIDVLIDWIKDRAELIIGRKLEEDDFTWYLDGNGSSRIILPVVPITTITALYIDSSRAFTTAEDTANYYTNVDNGIITLYNKTTPKMPVVIKVEATAGYTDETLPPSLQFAFIEAIKWNLSRWNDGYFGRTNQSTPDGVSVGYEMVLPMGVQRVFESYREVHI